MEGILNPDDQERTLPATIETGCLVERDGFTELLDRVLTV
jgi:hypothetical protein